MTIQLTSKADQNLMFLRRKAEMTFEPEQDSSIFESSCFVIAGVHRAGETKYTYKKLLFAGERSLVKTVEKVGPLLGYCRWSFR